MCDKAKGILLCPTASCSDMVNKEVLDNFYKACELIRRTFNRDCGKKAYGEEVSILTRQFVKFLPFKKLFGNCKSCSPLSDEKYGNHYSMNFMDKNEHNGGEETG